MTKRLVNPVSLYDGTPLGLSQGIIDEESSLVFVSGQVDWDLQHQVSHNSVAGQFGVALENLRGGAYRGWLKRGQPSAFENLCPGRARRPHGSVGAHIIRLPR